MNQATIRDRIVEFTRVPGRDLVPNPRNWRHHPPHQRKALQGLLGEIGIADVAITRRLADGRLMLIDGHLRGEELADSDVPVVVLDVTEEEADKLLLTMDPLAALAQTDAPLVRELADRVEASSESVRAMIHDMLTTPRAAPFLVADLKDHPQNYRTHPEDQLAHLVASIEQHGFYRNVVAAKDGTILAGHGIVEAARHFGLVTLPVVRLDIEPDSPQALKILAGDNEVARQAESDDRTLTDLLKRVKDTDVSGLLGTGFDPQMLAALAYVTRPASEIRRMDAAAEWAGAGMPEFQSVPKELQVVILFRNAEDRQQFADLIGIVINDVERRQLPSFWWPPKEKDDAISVRFEG